MVDITIKITSIHVVMGIITAFLSSAVTVGWLPFTNHVVAGVLPFIIVYFTGQLCQKLFVEEGEKPGFGKWFWDGIAPFFFIWIIVYTFIYNYTLF